MPTIHLCCSLFVNANHLHQSYSDCDQHHVPIISYASQSWYHIRALRFSRTQNPWFQVQILGGVKIKRLLWTSYLWEPQCWSVNKFNSVERKLRWPEHLCRVKKVIFEGHTLNQSKCKSCSELVKVFRFPFLKSCWHQTGLNWRLYSKTALFECR